MSERIGVLVETTRQRTFASAVDWPGWSRAGRTPDQALEALAAYLPRYAPVARLAGQEPPSAGARLDIVETVEGDATTAFGAPSRIGAADRAPSTAAEAGRFASLVEAAWGTFERVASTAPEALRKGPRGGGRDTSRIVDHVLGADRGYAGQLGLRVRLPERPGPEDVARLRAAVLEVIGRPSDGTPVGKSWTPRYAARRIAWHALDHAWEIEDRSGPA